MTLFKGVSTRSGRRGSFEPSSHPGGAAGCGCRPFLGSVLLDAAFGPRSPLQAVSHPF